MYTIYTKHAAKFKDDILSGLTVALALVPESVAFSFIAGISPVTGLYGSVIIGLISSLVGGRPGMISGFTGALAVVMVSLIKDHGIEYLFAATLLMGLIQITAGLMKLGKFIRMVPVPVILGFVNGLAIVIFLSQMPQLQDVAGSWLPPEKMFPVLGMAALTMAIMFLLPRVTKVVPAGLVAIIIGTLLVYFFPIPVQAVGDIAKIKGTLPSFHFPMVPFTWDTLKIIAPYSFILAGVGLIESLLTMTVIDEITDTRGRGNRLSIGQGAANVACGLFAAPGGCAMIGQSMININSGGLRNLSGISAALFLLAFILFLSPLIEIIPTSTLVGIMFMVVIGTFEWGTFKMMRQIPKEDYFVVVLVASVTVFTHNLALAVILGVVVAALVFAWKHAKNIDVHVNLESDGRTKIYRLQGPLFFASTHRFQILFDPSQDPDVVIIDFLHSRVMDHSAVKAVDYLAERYRKAGKELHLRHLSEDCRLLLDKAGDLVDINIEEDPKYKVASNMLA